MTRSPHHPNRVVHHWAALFFLAWGLSIPAGCTGSVGNGDTPLTEAGGPVGDGPSSKARQVFKSSFSQMGQVNALAARGSMLYVSAASGVFVYLVGQSAKSHCSVLTGSSSTSAAPVQAPVSLDSAGNLYFTRALATRCLASVDSSCKYRWNLSGLNYVDCKGNSDTQPGLLPGESQVVIATYADGNGDAHVWNISAGSGKEVWHQTLKGHSVRRALYAHGDGSIYVGTDYNNTGVLYRFSASSSAPTKVFDQAYSIRAPPLVSSDGTILFGDYNSNLYALSHGGTVKWKANAQGPILTNPVVHGSTVLVAAALYGVFSRKLDGSASWQLPLPDVRYSGMGLDTSGILYIGSKGKCTGSGDGGCLFAVRDGKILWSMPTDRPIDATPLWHANMVIVGDDGGTLYAFQPLP